MASCSVRIGRPIIISASNPSKYFTGGCNSFVLILSNYSLAKFFHYSKGLFSDERNRCFDRRLINEQLQSALHVILGGLSGRLSNHAGGSEALHTQRFFESMRNTPFCPTSDNPLWRDSHRSHNGPPQALAHARAGCCLDRASFVIFVP